MSNAACDGDGGATITKYQKKCKKIRMKEKMYEILVCRLSYIWPCKQTGEGSNEVTVRQSQGTLHAVP